jgi:hypothetical protein
MNQSLTDLSASQLRQAADIKENIENLEHRLNQILGGRAQTGNGAPVQKKQTMSPAVRARIAAAARARWARIKGKTSPKPAKHGRKMSAAARAHLAAIARARWKKAKSAGKKAL